MKMTREEMMTRVIRKYGFEDNMTIAFCEIAEQWASDNAVKDMYDIAMAKEIDEEE